ncbi:hypothetical protein F2Q70_00036164 [Brassica cretica]|uniref:Uncharacterized protein n=1 Tax=Brassica cretica TaxID=69181 RepID=A0A8S9JVR5_BRACR|nr:hypothetical protein F2Q70_00036164 [Brassica cretica]
MEGSPYRKFSFSRGKGAVPGTRPGVLRRWEMGLPLIARFRHRTRGITCALKSTGVAHSQQASLKQDIAPVILRSRVPLRLEPHSRPWEDRFPYSRPGSSAIEPQISCQRWRSSGLLMASWR